MYCRIKIKIVSVQEKLVIVSNPSPYPSFKTVLFEPLYSVKNIRKNKYATEKHCRHSFPHLLNM